MINEVNGELADTIEYKNAKLDADSLPKIKGMPFLLKQLFSNLISNSVKYASPDRKPEIKVYAEPFPVNITREDKNLYHLIYVADNGIGFEQEYAESIFNIFTRLHTGMEYKGSGVGLALCKKIMQNHGGHIMASGKTDEGSVISLYFPVETP